MGTHKLQQDSFPVFPRTQKLPCAGSHVMGRWRLPGIAWNFVSLAGTSLCPLHSSVTLKLCVLPSSVSHRALPTPLSDAIPWLRARVLESDGLRSHHPLLLPNQVSFHLVTWRMRAHCLPGGTVRMESICALGHFTKE